ncbi:hypothetical protein [uncultured Dysosmobacter sp.]|uniref:hypothetical protein n=1 Tax=uncultured Dysosmobacter sp. TaxID=2591384 RepID=UPI0026247C6B|nr:hypothetical protein [uncultured Dysosmobacter sp.]
MSGKTKVNPRRQPASRADVERAKLTATSIAIRQTQAIVFLTLLDKEGWERAQLVKLWHEVGNTAESITQGYINLTDVINTLWEEYEIDLRCGSEGGKTNAGS